MPALQDPRITAEYEAVTASFNEVVQAAGLSRYVLNPSPYATPDAYRRAMVRALQSTLPRDTPLSVRADATYLPNAEFSRTEAKVRDAVIAQAHRADVLRPVVTVDQAGREITEYFGDKRGWMRAYQAPALLTKRIGNTEY
ncbi:hypothetical protein [Paraburkholderia fungorum]|jgi:hypothetical protein|uniref:hypothetical protein n=1 Tax=Paraburkholderia fungorum TaxID=134537 RepID=UPI0003FB1D02|nr:hypothetical protein [Paraburkholderia fungorum]PZR49638.1 MAG: hypothetical protein DI523_06965 [Paraburkholderia fungorum]